jgi:hypothetical protein
MSGPEQPHCREITLRLVAGESLGDPALVTHVGSCLQCFRTANEMRELPHIARLMRQAQRPALDPGDEFWAQFPGVVGAAWSSQRAASDRSGAGWRRLLGWFRLPVPAALSGAVVAVAVMMFAVNHRAAPRPDGVTSVAAMAEAAGDDEVPAAGEPILLDDDDPWSLLDLVDTRSVIAQDDGDVSALDDPSDGTPSSAEEVGLLDTEDLRIVEQALEARGRI